jgi:hypothetical protein
VSGIVEGGGRDGSPSFGAASSGASFVSPPRRSGWADDAGFLDARDGVSVEISCPIGRERADSPEAAGRDSNACGFFRKNNNPNSGRASEKMTKPVRSADPFSGSEREKLGVNSAA